MISVSQLFFSESTNIALQSFGSSFYDLVFKAITTVGAEQVYVFLASLIFWCFSKKTGIRTMYVILFTSFAAILAKQIFKMPRPPEYLHKIQETGFGFPSGHAFVSSGFWGYLGLKLRKSQILIAGAIMIISVSLSRIYLGVHYVGDVLGGIIFGLSVSFIFFKAENRAALRFEKLGRSSKYLLAILFPSLIVLITSLKYGFNEENIQIGIVMASVGIGYLLEEEHIRFEDALNNKQRIKRAVVGIVILGVIYLISGRLTLIYENFAYLKYALLGFSSLFVVPWVFKYQIST